MSNRTRYTLIALGLNLLTGVLMLVPFLLFTDSDSAVTWAVCLLFFTGISVAVQIITGIIFAAGNKRKALGQSMLLAIGIILLVGLSVCGSMLLGVGIW